MNTPINKKPDPSRAEILSVERHQGLKFHKAANFSFASRWISVPVHYKEAGRLGRDLPVFFVRTGKNSLMPCLLLKTPNKRALDGAGRWLPAAVPDVLRVYPFGWVKKGNRSHLTLYPDAPHFNGGGEKLITSKGKPTQKLNKIRQVLTQVQAAFDETAPLMEELQALNVLQPFSLSLGSGEQKRSQVLWAVPDNLTKLKLSHRLRTLLYVHQQSARSLLQQVQGKDQAQVQVTDQAEVQASAKDSEQAPQPAAGTGVDQLLDQACQQFGVTLDDLRSRKRNDTIKQARTALVQQAVACDCLDAMAVRLERTVDTLKKWM